MANYQVTWIRKPGGSSNPSTRIQDLGGPGWQASESDVISYINSGMHLFYVVAPNGQSSWVMVDHRGTTPYLKTHPDGTRLDNLLYLPNLSNQAARR